VKRQSIRLITGILGAVTLAGRQSVAEVNFERANLMPEPVAKQIIRETCLPMAAATVFRWANAPSPSGP
jgi:hypothetical protein